MAIESLNNTTCKADNLGDVKPKIVIGGKVKDKFVPNINMSFGFGGDEEFYINLNRKDKTVNTETASLSTGKVSQKIGDETDEYYIDKDGKLKWDIVFDSCPKSFDLQWEIKNSDGLEFLYQPETPETDTAIRPDNIKGSYAVYCNKSNNKYKTGKVCHIYRPFVIDEDGKTEWCVIKIDKSTLTITLPENFMESAAYPVRLDPTFGYTSNGASSDYWSSLCCSFATSTPASNGTLNSIYYYCRVNTGSGTARVAIYSNSSSAPSSRLAVNETGVSITNTSLAWAEISLSYASITSGTQYWLGHSWTADSLLYFGYDSGTNELSRMGTNTDAFPSSWTDVGRNSHRVSIYANYTASGGAVANSHYYRMNQ